MNSSSCLSIDPSPSSRAGYSLNGLGIALGCVGSISINIGNNLQAKGHAQLAAAKAGDAAAGQQPNWLALGTIVFVLASLIQFVAFAFAPASVVAPLESLQFVANIAFAKLVNRQTITSRMLGGTGLILLGTVLAVVFGPVDGTMLIPLEKLVAFWCASALCRRPKQRRASALALIRVRCSCALLVSFVCVVRVRCSWRACVCAADGAGMRLDGWPTCPW